MEESIFTIVPDEWKSASIISLPDPKMAGNDRKYMVCRERGLFEMMKWDDEVPRSLFIGDNVKKDGSIFMGVCVDPLFLLLPHLEKSRETQVCSNATTPPPPPPHTQSRALASYPFFCFFLLTPSLPSKNMFVQLEAIIPTDKYSGFRYFDEGSDMAARIDNVLELVCEVRGAGSIRAYRLDDEKLMKWLKAKVMQVALNVEDSMLTSTCMKKEIPFHTKLQFSYGVISTYLGDALAKKLHHELGLVVVEEKKDVMGEYAGMHALEDYSISSTTDPSGPPKKTPKLTAAQKQLQNVDKKGMKSIASFFGKKKK
eukprot:m.41365 g.41365  ORF g.41365 m.41365 type:complete len:313 (+) comp6995_c0_seq3:1-939(+)